MKKLNFKNLFFTLVSFMFIGALLSVPIIASAVVAVGAGTLMSFTPKTSGILQANLAKEIWTDIILEGFYPDGSFLNEARDMSYLVDFDTINLAEAGATPTAVLNTVFGPSGTPANSVNARTDTALSVVLDTLDTTTTVVRNIEEMEAAYDKMSSVVYGHKQELLRLATKLAAFNYAPASNAANTPVIACTGTAVTNQGKKMTFADVLALKLRFDQLDVPQEGRILVLSPQHESNLIEADIALYKAVLGNNSLFGFKISRTSVTPYYISSTGVKLAAYDTTVTPATHGISSIAFHKDEVMKAMGTVDVFARYKDPEWKGDLINFQMRFIAKSLRGKFVGAIYS
jgi:hypothetical protein